jgi:hypothetical protein
MTGFQGLYEIRDGKLSDHNFILSTFLRGLYYGETWFSEIPKDIFMDNYKVIANALINSPKVVIKVACLPEDLDTIIGYSILSSDYQTVHFVYIKKIWRERGVAKTLLPSHLTYVSHLTALGKLLLSKLKPAVFNPFSL